MNKNQSKQKLVEYKIVVRGSDEYEIQELVKRIRLTSYVSIFYGDEKTEITTEVVDVERIGVVDEIKKS